MECPIRWRLRFNADGDGGWGGELVGLCWKDTFGGGASGTTAGGMGGSTDGVIDGGGGNIAMVPRICVYKGGGVNAIGEAGGAMLIGLCGRDLGG